MRPIDDRLPATRQAEEEHATQQNLDSTHSRLEEQRYLADVMEALEADRLSEEERTHLKRVLIRCFGEAVRGGV
ncbi:MAG TPA: hypothetical protein VFA07_11140 [Chthonomonadaceae bacterium]|nr:hypothetical protein [Chthonomonadaceae bacterium]